MIKNIQLILITGILISLLASHASGLGISPGRRTFEIAENDGLDVNITYLLYPPQGQYSSFEMLDPMGLDATISGFSSTAGIEYNPDGSATIDWNAAGQPASISAYVNLKSPDSWQNPVAPGNKPMEDLFWYSESIPPAIVRAVSQLVLMRNYAIKGEVVGLEDSYEVNTSMQFELDVTDYANYDMFLNRFDFSWSIDWESDGIIDENQSNIRMVGELGETASDDIVRGFKYQNLDFEHAYSEPGDYIATLKLTDRIETTTLQIPITIVPEPATLVLLGLGGLFIKKRFTKKV